MKWTLYLVFICLFFACEENETPTNTDDPRNLTVDVLVYDDNSGTVVISANAENTTEYHFYMGDGETNPVVNANGTYEYNYKASGSYVIEVRAYGPSGRFIKKTVQIQVLSEDPVDIGEGYSTPLSYPNMELYWNDEFSGNILNQEYWCYDIGDGCPNLCGWGNNELEYYKSENVSVSGGLLTLEARDEPFGGREYTSGKIVTRDKQAFHFGRIDIRAIMPKGQGIWPALWLLGINQPFVGWPKCGEIDIMEMKGGNGLEKQVSANAFWDSNGTVDNPKIYTLDEGTFADEYHVFSLIWDEQKLIYLVDDNEYHSINITTDDRTEFQKEFYMIFNVAVGGNYPGNPDSSTVFPTSMKVDYVRAFRNI